MKLIATVVGACVVATVLSACSSSSNTNSSTSKTGSSGSSAAAGGKTVKDGTFTFAYGFRPGRPRSAGLGREQHASTDHPVRLRQPCSATT